MVAAAVHFGIPCTNEMPASLVYYARGRMGRAPTNQGGAPAGGVESATGYQWTDMLPCGETRTTRAGMLPPGEYPACTSWLPPCWFIRANPQRAGRSRWRRAAARSQMSGTAPQMSGTAPQSPLLRRYENMCIHVAFRGSMNRQGYAWLLDHSHGHVPNPPLFSRHVEFIPSEQDLHTLRTWWNPTDINRTVGRPGQRVVVRASAQTNPGLGSTGTRTWLPGVSWFIDISHGGTPNLWSNICHWSDTVMPFFEAANLGQVARRPIGQVLMWQVPADDGRLGSTVKVPPWQCGRSARVPRQGTRGGSRQPGTPWKWPCHWPPSHRLGCSR